VRREGRGGPYRVDADRDAEIWIEEMVCVGMLYCSCLYLDQHCPRLLALLDVPVYVRLCVRVCVCVGVRGTLYRHRYSVEIALYFLVFHDCVCICIYIPFLHLQGRWMGCSHLRITAWKGSILLLAFSPAHLPARRLPHSLLLQPTSNPYKDATSTRSNTLMPSHIK